MEDLVNSDCRADAGNTQTGVAQRSNYWCFVVGRPLHCRVFSSIPGFCQLHVGDTSIPTTIVQTKNVSRHGQMSLRESHASCWDNQANPDLRCSNYHEFGS